MCYLKTLTLIKFEMFSGGKKEQNFIKCKIGLVPFGNHMYNQRI
jgi:hypothetical protein